MKNGVKFFAVLVVFALMYSCSWFPGTRQNSIEGKTQSNQPVTSVKPSEPVSVNAPTESVATTASEAKYKNVDLEISPISIDKVINRTFVGYRVGNKNIDWLIDQQKGGNPILSVEVETEKYIYVNISYYNNSKKDEEIWGTDDGVSFYVSVNQTKSKVRLSYSDTAYASTYINGSNEYRIYLIYIDKYGNIVKK